MALPGEYLRRIIEHLGDGSAPQDILKFSSEILVSLFQEAHNGSLPAWCAPVSIQEYRHREYEKIQAELIKLFQTNRNIWDIRRDEVILSVSQAESFGLRKEIPDWLLKAGSKGGNIVLDRKPLEEFLGISFSSSWLHKILGK